jgi:ABC-type sugar transport system ATPase subunit
VLAADTPLLRLDSIDVTYRGAKRSMTQPWQGFSFDMMGGELVVIIGDSGTGKSTLLDVIAGFIRPHKLSIGFGSRAHSWLVASASGVTMKGTVLIDGQDVSHLEPRERDVGLVMQRFNLYPHMSVRKNLEFPLRMSRDKVHDISDRVNEIAEKLRIIDYLERSPNELSGGQQQRVAIGKMLLRNPRLALLDEAFSNLDWELREFLHSKVIEPFRTADRLGEKHKGVIVVTHILQDAVAADRIILLRRENSQRIIKLFPEQTGGNAWGECDQYLSQHVESYKAHIAKLFLGKT